MASLDQKYKTKDMPEGTNYEPLPIGWYDVEIVEAELKATKAGTGKYINLQMKITGPTYEGRIVFSMLNIDNQSAKAEEIGRRQLGDIMRAIGLDAVNDTDQLIGGTFQVKLGIAPGTDQYDPKNTVKGYAPLKGKEDKKEEKKKKKKKGKKEKKNKKEKTESKDRKDPPWDSKKDV